MTDRRLGESSDELTAHSASPFDPTLLVDSEPTQVQGPAPLEVAPLSTARPLPPPPSSNLTAVSEPGAPPSQPEADLAAGYVLGDYIVERKIGRGGMGDVYLGVHALIKKRAAIKLLRGDDCRDDATVARFLAEARVVNEIGHPNIVDVFAFGVTPDGRHYLVMEWLQGESLRARLERGRLDVEETSTIVRPLIRALITAHTKGVVHRDLKPDNVFLAATPGEATTVKLLDFGIAKLSRPDPQIAATVSGVLVGTPMYIAPEQARGQAVDHRADIYTLGGMLFEMLTGRPPFLATSAYEIVAKHLMEPPVRPSTLVRIPRELDDLVFAMLAKDPAHRPALADALRVFDSCEEFGQRPTTEFQTERESMGSIALTSLRAAEVAPDFAPRTPPRTARGLLPVILALAAIVVAVVAFLGVTQPEPSVVALTPPPASDTVAARAAQPTKPATTKPAQTNAAGSGTATVQSVDPVDTVRQSTEQSNGGTTEKPGKLPSKSPQRAASMPEVGKLVLTVEGASSFEVLVDKRKVSPGPSGEISLSHGGHAVKVTAPGMTTETFHIEAGANAVTRKVTLKRIVSPKSGSGLDGDQMLFRSGEVKGGKK